MNLTAEQVINLLHASHSGDFQTDGGDWVKIQGRILPDRFNALLPVADQLTFQTAVWLYGDRPPQEWWHKDDAHFHTADGLTLAYSTEFSQWRVAYSTGAHTSYEAWEQIPDFHFPVMLHPGLR